MSRIFSLPLLNILTYFLTHHIWSLIIKNLCDQTFLMFKNLFTQLYFITSRLIDYVIYDDQCVVIHNVNGWASSFLCSPQVSNYTLSALILPNVQEICTDGIYFLDTPHITSIVWILYSCEKTNTKLFTYLILTTFLLFCVNYG